GSGLGDSSGGQLQAAERQAHFQDGSAAPSLRGARLAGIENHRPLLDRRPRAGVVCAYYVEASLAKWFYAVKKRWWWVLNGRASPPRTCWWSTEPTCAPQTSIRLPNCLKPLRSSIGSEFHSRNRRPQSLKALI